VSHIESGSYTTSKPKWLKVRFPSHKNFFSVSHLLKEEGLHTICQSARCPNITECWTHKTATFLILGDVCTRNCAFCAVKKGVPFHSGEHEAERVAQAVNQLGLRYCVITSVTRDDLSDGGASQFAALLKRLRTDDPELVIEVLIPDFNGSKESLATVLAENPNVLNHNIEVPEPLYPSISRPILHYRRSLEVLKRAKSNHFVTKSGLMIGLGESQSDILKSLWDLRDAECDLLTIGQYLQPSKQHIPVKKYYTPAEFAELKSKALDLGFMGVESGPLVRSSYMAHRMYRQLDGRQ
jgi:lipoyl synthase